MTESLLDCVERTIGGAPRLSVIWLHGLGANAHDFDPVVGALGLAEGYRFVFPDAPTRPVTINGGCATQAWFDIYSLDSAIREDEAGIAEAAVRIGALIDREMSLGVPSRSIVLAGFSQGGALALYAALRESRPLAGVLALSSFLPCATRLGAEKSAANAQVPVFMAHGRVDPVVRLEYAQASRRRLETEGFQVDWNCYAMAHEVIPTELQDISSWLRARHALAAQ